MEPVATGVFYDQGDYAGVWRRLGIDAIDTTAVVLLTFAIGWVLVFLWPHEGSLGLVLLASTVALWFSYFVLLKRSRFRTIGYVIGGTRIVNLKGETPSIGSLCMRLLFAVAGPFNFLVDLLWISSDPSRQALRDKFAHTYVVRKTAVPAGNGRIVYRTYTLLGAALLFGEVQRSRGDG